MWLPIKERPRATITNADTHVPDANARSGQIRPDTPILNTFAGTHAPGVRAAARPASSPAFAFAAPIHPA